VKPGMQWPIGVAVVLGATVIANVVVMRIANSDKAFAIEPDYYKRAVAFDSTLATERRSDALKWSASAQFLAQTEATQRTLAVTLTDAQGVSVQGAIVTVTTLANARANAVLSARLQESSPGRYQGSLSATFPGQWEVRIDAVRGAQHFVTTTRTELSRSDRTRPVPVGETVGPTVAPTVARTGAPTVVLR
jgi:nitrogen fixation protein FixH